MSRTVPAPADLGIEVLGVAEGSPVDLDLRLEAVMEGVLVTGTASAAVVGLVMCTVQVAPPAIETGWPTRVSDWLPTAPVIWNVFAGVCPPAGIDQLRSAPFGSGSVNWRPVARALPVFLIVTVNPIG